MKIPEQVRKFFSNRWVQTFGPSVLVVLIVMSGVALRVATMTDAERQALHNARQNAKATEVAAQQQTAQQQLLAEQAVRNHLRLLGLYKPIPVDHVTVDGYRGFFGRRCDAVLLKVTTHDSATLDLRADCKTPRQFAGNSQNEVTVSVDFAGLVQQYLQTGRLPSHAEILGGHVVVTQIFLVPDKFWETEEKVDYYSW